MSLLSILISVSFIISLFGGFSVHAAILNCDALKNKPTKITWDNNEFLIAGVSLHKREGLDPSKYGTYYLSGKQIEIRFANGKVVRSSFKTDGKEELVIGDNRIHASHSVQFSLRTSYQLF